MGYEYLTLDGEATEAAVMLLAKAARMRGDGKPDAWARDVERKALRQFERSYWLRYFPQDRPPVLPPATYSYDPKRKQ